MDPLKTMINASILGSPLVIGVGWGLWLRRDGALSRGWRFRVLLMALIAVSANAIVYYTWFAYGTMASDTDAVSQWKNTLGDDIGVPLVLAALAGAIGGKGAARPIVALAALMGFFLWLSIGVL
jgi:hypothetical protein